MEELRESGSVRPEVGRTGKSAFPREKPGEPQPSPLTWKLGTFRVLIAENNRREELHEIQVRGPVSSPFGVFKGNGRGPAPPGHSFFSLIHLPTGRLMITLSQRRQCMAMAAELAPLRVPWQETDPEKVLEGAPDQMMVQKIKVRYEAIWR